MSVAERSPVPEPDQINTAATTPSVAAQYTFWMTGGFESPDAASLSSTNEPESEVVMK